MSPPGWRAVLLRRLGWSLALASIWTWGLLLLRMLRDGWQPLEVWYGYSLAFLMTAVYAYMGLLIWDTLRVEGRRAAPLASPASEAGGGRLARWRRPAAVVGWLGLVVAVASLAGWLLLRYPGPAAAAGTGASILLALMVLAVATLGTLIARGAR